MDSSALVKRYVQEVGTSWVRSLTHRGTANQIYLVRITAVEVTSAVARRRRGLSLSFADVQALRELSTPQLERRCAVLPPKSALGVSSQLQDGLPLG